MAIDDCFWPGGCSDRKRCEQLGICVAAAQARDFRNMGVQRGDAPTALDELAEIRQRDKSLDSEWDMKCDAHDDCSVQRAKDRRFLLKLVESRTSKSATECDHLELVRLDNEYALTYKCDVCSTQFTARAASETTTEPEEVRVNRLMHEITQYRKRGVLDVVTSDGELLYRYSPLKTAGEPR